MHVSLPDWPELDHVDVKAVKQVREEYHPKDGVREEKAQLIHLSEQAILSSRLCKLTEIQKETGDFAEERHITDRWETESCDSTRHKPCESEDVVIQELDLGFGMVGDQIFQCDVVNH